MYLFAELPSPNERDEIFNEALDVIAPISSQTALNAGSNTSLDGPPPEIPPPRENKPPAEGYIDLGDCYSGPKVDDDGPISSIPMDFPPPPPIKTHQKMVAQGGDTLEDYDSPPKSYKNNPAADVDDNDNEYKYPPSSHRSVDQEPPGESLGSIYKHPPIRSVPKLATNNQNELYNKVPPARSTEFKGTPKKSSGDTGEVASEEDDDVYKVPPSRPDQVEYDIPPSTAPMVPSHNLQRKPSERDSGSSTASKGSQGHTDDSGFSEATDQAARSTRHGSSSHQTSELGATAYQAKNSLLGVVPPPPPPTPHKTSSDMANNSRYINVPSNSKSHPECQVPPPGIPHKNPDIAYDFPVSSAPSQRKKSDAEILGMSPPPPPCDKKGAMNIHRYTNAPPGYIPCTPDSGGSSYLPMSPTSSTGSGDSYLPMDRKDSSSSSYLPMDNGQGVQNNSYMPMDKQPKQDYLPMDNTGSKEGYMPMGSGPRDDSYLPADPTTPKDTYFPAAEDKRDSIYGIITDSSMSRSSDIYAYPPSNIPVTEEVYDVSPSNIPVVSLQTQLPPPVTRTSDVYATHPSNKPIAGGSQRSKLDAHPPAPSRESTYDTPPPRPILSQKVKPPTSSPRFKPKGKCSIAIQDFGNLVVTKNKYGNFHRKFFIFIEN